MKKLNVAVLFGGCSEEYGISLKSAHTVLTNMDRNKYDPVIVGITPEGEWLKYDGPVECILSDTWKSSEYCTPAIISPNRMTKGLVVFYGKQIAIMPLDVVFPMLHGKHGEDGAIQGLLELAGIPYVGCGVESSVLCMDKELAYRIVRTAGVKTPRFNVLVNPSAIEIAGADKGLVYPLFVKPARSGSSFGVTKVLQPDELTAAVGEAGKFDGKVLIEEGIEGAETGCAVLGNGDELAVGEVDEIELSHGFFRIHQESQPEVSSVNSTIHVPARFSPEIRQTLQQTARTIYHALGCSGLARVDMFITADQQVYFNEVNTMPGFTSYSRYPRMMAAAGRSAAQVIDQVIQLAVPN
jgi:D-alanine--(R)-lactate ligase